MVSAVSDNFAFVINMSVLEKHVNVRSQSMKMMKWPQALMKKQVEDNLACVASVWIGGSSVNVGPE